MPKKTSTKRKKPANAMKAKRVSTASVTKVMKMKKKMTTPIKDRFTSSQIASHIAEETGLPRRQVSEVFESLSDLMQRHLKKGGAGEFSYLGMKMKIVRKPATKERRGTNPFTGEPAIFKAKPARNVVKIRPLKKLKELIEK